MLLQLLIPQYNEDESIIKNMLDSLAIQQGIDFNQFEVLIPFLLLLNHLLNSLPKWNLVDGSEEAERELARIANEENPDWLYDEDYRYSGNTGI